MSEMKDMLGRSAEKATAVAGSDNRIAAYESEDGIAAYGYENSAAAKERIRELVELLNKARKAYEQEDMEIMSNLEYDKLYDELAALEKETGMVFSNSPTVNVGYEVLSDLPKERHPSPMLSLDKTKDVETLVSWLGDQKGLLSWKLDGLTIVLTYEEGRLVKAVTRGNGEIGEVITGNARMFANLPLSISHKGRLVLRGEAIITYSDFERINATIEDVEAKYKNPRNLCSGSVRQLNNRITKERNVKFYAFGLVEAEGVEFKTRTEQLEWLAEHGFTVVEYMAVKAGSTNNRSSEADGSATDSSTGSDLMTGGADTDGFAGGSLQTDKKLKEMGLREAVEYFAEHVAKNDFPSDGLVLIFDDIAYGRSLGSTSKFPRDAIAFKWRDEIRETVLKEIEWSASRTGLINPVAIFEPVELEGTTVSRASVHNLSILRQLQLGIGDRIEVYKANMIIPQIAENLTRSGNLEIPAACPVCGGETAVRAERDAETLCCTNPHCPAKQVKAFAHFVSRNAMNIEGLSEATIEKFIAEGFIKEFADIFKLERFRDRIVVMEGFGEKSYANLVEAAEKAAKTTTVRLLYGLGIPNIGVANAKLICRAADFDWEKIQSLSATELVEIQGIGDIMAESYEKFFADEENRRIIADLMEVLTIEKKRPSGRGDAAGRSESGSAAEDGYSDGADSAANADDSSAADNGSGWKDMSGITFVITGSLAHFSNRDELKEIIEYFGGKVSGSVSSKTSFLINNDNMSGSTKNKKAKELGVPIITEEEFIERFK